MPKQFLLLVIVLSTLNTQYYFGQTLRLNITNEKEEIIEDVIIYKNKIAQNSKLNLYKIHEFDVKTGDEILIQHEFYKDFVFHVKEENDTIYKLVQLLSEYQLFDEIEISNEKYKRIFQQDNNFIIDYYPLPRGQILIIKKIQKDNYIELLNSEGKSTYIEGLTFKPKKIELDAIGNMHLVSKDSVYQIHANSDGKVDIVSTISVNKYYQYISNLINLQNSYAVYQNYSLHNQEYKLIARNNIKPDSVIFKVFDVKRYESASYEYSKAINRYNSTTSEDKNVIKLGLWDGDLMTLPSDDLTLLTVTGWYKNVVSKPLNVAAFGMIDDLIVLNGVSDKILHISYKNFDIIKKKKLDYKLTGQYFHDYFFNSLYMIGNLNGKTNIFKINVNDGNIKTTREISDFQYPENIKVSNNKLYFLVKKENGFNELFQLIY